jgi:hypothetical protein|tara:strand:- start:1760 stop:2827 length:1068 start_codon:yes stop_codon:yes gene_type:complete
MTTLFSQLNNTQPGFIYAGPWIDDTYALRALWIWFPSSDVSSPVLSSFTQGSCPTVAFGKGRFVQPTYYGNQYRYHIWDASNTADTRTPWSTADLATAVNANQPSFINYANGMFMSTPYNNNARVGDVLTSTNGWNWTTYAGVLPSQQGGWRAPQYNTVTGTWLTRPNDAAGSFHRSADAGASWTSVSSIPTTNSAGCAFDNGRWIITDGTYNVNRVWQSLDDANSWQSVSIPTGMSFVNGITWNEYDSQFVIVGGNWPGDGSIDARVYTSPDGTTWTARESGSTKVALNNVKGDNAGNYIALGWTYSSSYNPTTVYMYSTDNAATWTAGTLPASCYLPYGWEGKLAWGDIRLGL